LIHFYKRYSEPIKHFDNLNKVSEVLELSSTEGTTLPVTSPGTEPVTTDTNQGNIVESQHQE